MEFPQTETIFGEVFYPGLIIDVWLKNIGYQPFEFILDSGADCTMVPRFISELLGRQLPDSPDTYVAGISGRSIPAYKGQLRLRIHGEEFEARCLFTKSDRTPFLLGRIDVFSLFDIQFDGHNCQIILEKVP